MIDWERYIGIPYKYGSYEPREGLFCWSLARWIMAEEFGVDLPKAPFNARNRVREEGAGFAAGFFDFREVPLESARCGDIAQMQTLHKGKWLPVHVAVFVDSNHIIHVEDERMTSHILDLRKGMGRCRIVKVGRPKRS